MEGSREDPGERMRLGRQLRRRSARRQRLGSDVLPAIGGVAETVRLDRRGMKLPHGCPQLLGDPRQRRGLVGDQRREHRLADLRQGEGCEHRCDVAERLMKCSDLDERGIPEIGTEGVEAGVAGLVADDVGALAGIDRSLPPSGVEKGKLGPVVVGVKIVPRIERHRQRLRRLPTLDAMPPEQRRPQVGRAAERIGGGPVAESSRPWVVDPDGDRLSADGEGQGTGIKDGSRPLHQPPW